MKWFIKVISICLLVIAMGCRTTDESIEGMYGDSYFGRCRIYADTIDIYRPEFVICYPMEEVNYILTARCTIEKIEGEFYSVNSITSPNSELYKNIQIVRTESYENSDSIDIEFVLPNYEDKIRIIAHSESDYEAIAHKRRCLLRLPSSCREFILEIVPLSYLTYFSPPVFNGLVRFTYDKPIQCDAATKATILLPGVTLELLADYYLENEYIRITRKGVYMLGEFWKRDPQN